MLSEAADKILIALAEGYEAGNRFWKALVDATEDEKEFVAGLKAEGSLEEFHGLIRFTDKGFNKYKDRIHALKRLP